MSAMLSAEIFACLAAFAVLVWLLRRDQQSFGIPIAYLFSLLLIHVPGAIAHVVGAEILSESDLTERGMRYATVGVLCFVAGVWIARRRTPVLPERRPAAYRAFRMFCFLGGWFFTYTLGFLQAVPTLGAAITKGGAVWMLGVMLGLREAVARRQFGFAFLWLAALSAFPVMTIMFWGFLSYGSAATIIVLAILVISVRSHWRVVAGLVVVSVLGFNFFLSYFHNRENLRETVWYGTGMGDRLDIAADMLRDFEWFDPEKEAHLNALDQRLNQNYFVGLAAERIEDGIVSYLDGKSIWDGVLALVPRVLWPEKPVAAGSGTLVSEMTGLLVDEETSFGVGNVMEFQMNFGMPGVIVGFLLLGGLMGWLDRQLAIAESAGDLGMAIMYFLPTIALIQPNGSMVEMVGGAGAALGAAYFWRWLWMRTFGKQSEPKELRSPVVRRA